MIEFMISFQVNVFLFYCCLDLVSIFVLCSFFSMFIEFMSFSCVSSAQDLTNCARGARRRVLGVYGGALRARRVLGVFPGFYCLAGGGFWGVKVAILRQFDSDFIPGLWQ
jgi:hypothetical protein